MESDILDILDQVGYDGPLSEEACLLAQSGRGFSSPEYVGLVMWLSKRLAAHLGDTHTPTIITADPDGCVVDVARLLKDCCCPYEGLASRLMNGDVKDTADHLKIILFLASELQAAQMCSSRAASAAAVEETDAPLPDLRLICETLELPDPAQRDARDVFTHIETQVKVLLQQVPETHIGEPAFRSVLSAEQWAELQRISGALSVEYECRRRMLIKRLDVTVQSFSWSDRAKARTDRMARVYQPQRRCLSPRACVSVPHLLAARLDVCNLVKTSSGSSREKSRCALNKILMGRVPDRGGRPAEIQAPPPEMPPWQRRSEGGGRGSWNRGGGGGWRPERWSRGGRAYR